MSRTVSNLSPSLSFCSRSVLGRVLSRDVPSVSAVWLPLSGARLLEGQSSRWRAHHNPRVHHDNWNPLQGGHSYVWEHCSDFPLTFYILIHLIRLHTFVACNLQGNKNKKYNVIFLHLILVKISREWHSQFFFAMRFFFHTVKLKLTLTGLPVI